VRSLRLPAGQQDLPYVAERYRVDDWVRYAGFPRGAALSSPSAVRSLAASRPDDVVLVVGMCGEPDLTGVCVTLTFGAGPHPAAVPPRIETAAALAARLP